MNKLVSNKGDIIISIAVLIQPTLVLLQTVLIGVFHFNQDVTTSYRVLLTAIPMILAIFVAAYRRLSMFVASYSLAILIMLLHSVIFPLNSEYIFAQGTRFFLPVVLPSLLCIVCVRNYEVVEKTLYVVSWVSALLALFYIFSFLRGVLQFSNYNMSYSYACLLPMVSLYLHKKPWDIVAVAILFLSVLAIGSRGAAIYFMLFVVVDVFQHKSKWRWVVVILILVFVFIFPYLSDFFYSVGIQSRTLSMYSDGSITDDSGRYYFQKYFWNRLVQSPWIGLGVWGDRTLDNVVYCHNVLLEICLDFGLLIGPSILLCLLYRFIRVYIKSSYEYKNQLIGYFSALILPLMTSGSYLTSNELFLFIGFCYLVKNKNKNKNKNAYIPTR